MENNKLKAYLNDIGNGELLSDEQEQQLAARIEAGDDEAAGQLASANLRYVVSVAKGYAGRGLALDDLVSEGNMGLLRAAAKYKGTQKKRFVVFAAPFVRESIERAISEQAGLSSMPTEKADAEKSRNKVRSVDEPIPAGSKNSFSLLHVLEDKDSPRADVQVEQTTLTDEMIQSLSLLNEREQQVVRRCYGVECEPLTMAEIGAEMGLKRERVRQIRDKALRKMRKGRP